MVEEPETQRLCVTKAASGVVEAEEEEVLLEAKMKPEIIGDQGAVDFHNCGGWHDQQIFLDPGGNPRLASSSWASWPFCGCGCETLVPGKKGLGMGCQRE